jgi:pyruvate dehydrogenase E1 component alpha subunit
MNDIQAYRLMRCIRFFEEKVEQLFLEGEIGGTAHTCIGQEAVAVGIAAAMLPQDTMTSTHRGHGHLIARGGDPKRLMAELFGRADGYSQGRGGSQMMMDTAIGFYGANGITAGSCAFALGLALKEKLKTGDAVCFCIIGDGAANQGIFAESLNLASLWKLPVVYVVENNRYAMSTKVSRGSAEPAIFNRATGYAMRSMVADGNDYREVKDAAMQARTFAAEEGPVLLELNTYRLSGHSRGDPRSYRSKAEETEAWLNDPIVRFERSLIENGMKPEVLENEKLRTAALIDEAVEFAHRSPLPEIPDFSAEIFAEEDRS